LEGFQEFSGIIIDFNRSITIHQEWTDYSGYHCPFKKMEESRMKTITIGKLVKELEAFLNDRMAQKIESNLSI